MEVVNENAQMLALVEKLGASPDISRYSVETRTAFPLECALVLVFKSNQRAGHAETKLYRRI